MPLWLDMLRTPMAAPETPQLRRMRRTALWLCLASALAVTAIRPLIAAMGRGAPLGIGVLLIFYKLDKIYPRIITEMKQREAAEAEKAAANA